MTVAKRSPSELIHYFESRLPQALDTLQRLVELESNSKDKAGIDALAAYLSRQFSLLGADVEILSHSVRGNALRARWRRAGTGKPVLLLGHLDTVWPKGTLQTRPFRHEDGKAWGPGIFDMKGGILLCLLVFQALSENLTAPERDVIVLLTADEEIGSEAGLAHIRATAARCGVVLCLEPPLPGGRVKTSRKGCGTFSLHVLGRSAHAGVDHEKGANAIVELSRHLIRLHELTNYQRGITISVGTIRGGTAVNAVPAEAEAEVDFRVSALEDAQGIEAMLQDLRPYDPRCRLEVRSGIIRPPLERTDAVARLYRKARALALPFGLELGEGSTGGGSDGSLTAGMGIPTLDGLGIDGNGAHAVDEYIIVSDIVPRASWLCRMTEMIYA